MNVNGIMLGLEGVTGLEVEEDTYEGKNEEFITFTYADEHYDEFGDNKPIAEQCDMQIRIVLLKDTDYFELKEKIKIYLLKHDAFEMNAQSYMDSTEDPKKHRILLITCKFKEKKEIEL